MPNTTNLSSIEQNAARDCTIKIVNNYYPPDVRNEVTDNDTEAQNDLHTNFQYPSGLPIERIINVLKLSLSTKEDKDKREIFLKTHISHENAFDILNLTYELNNLTLKNITENFIKENIKHIIEKDKIPQISEERLEFIFKNMDDDKYARTLFYSIKKWKNEKPTERRKHFCRLMLLIGDKTLESNDYRFIVADFIEELDHCESCVEMLKKIIKHLYSEIFKLQSKLRAAKRNDTKRDDAKHDDAKHDDAKPKVSEGRIFHARLLR